MCEVLDRIENKGRTEVAVLMQRMFDENRVDDLKRASKDPGYMDQLLKEYDLIAAANMKES